MPDIEFIEEFDDFAALRNRLRLLSKHVEEWSGIPIPIEGEQLTIEPSYPWANVFGNQNDDNDDEEFKLRNVFWSRRHRCRVYIWEEKDGSIHHGLDPMKTIDCEFRTLGCSVAWGIEQESRALKTLALHLPHRHFKQYLLTGMFLETSRRSGITYLFRKLRPTVAITKKEATPKVLAALCMHPIGYYQDSWAGAMCPTDDVIAHLMLMRGDEAMYWRRCEQHPPYAPEAGI